ncbi:hypothetical protein D3C81_937730 [compost metagenome]
MAYRAVTCRGHQAAALQRGRRIEARLGRCHRRDRRAPRHQRRAQAGRGCCSGGDPAALAALAGALVLTLRQRQADAFGAEGRRAQAHAGGIEDGVGHGGRGRQRIGRTRGQLVAPGERAGQADFRQRCAGCDGGERLAGRRLRGGPVVEGRGGSGQLQGGVGNGLFQRARSGCGLRGRQRFAVMPHRHARDRQFAGGAVDFDFRHPCRPALAGIVVNGVRIGKTASAPHVASRCGGMRDGWGPAGALADLPDQRGAPRVIEVREPQRNRIGAGCGGDFVEMGFARKDMGARRGKRCGIEGGHGAGRADIDIGNAVGRHDCAAAVAGVRHRRRRMRQPQCQRHGRRGRAGQGCGVGVDGIAAVRGVDMHGELRIGQADIVGAQPAHYGFAGGMGQHCSVGGCVVREQGRIAGIGRCLPASQRHLSRRNAQQRGQFFAQRARTLAWQPHVQHAVAPVRDRGARRCGPGAGQRPLVVLRVARGGAGKRAVGVAAPRNGVALHGSFVRARRRRPAGLQGAGGVGRLCIAFRNHACKLVAHHDRAHAGQGHGGIAVGAEQARCQRLAVDPAQPWRCQHMGDEAQGSRRWRVFGQGAGLHGLPYEFLLHDAAPSPACRISTAARRTARTISTCVPQRHRLKRSASRICISSGSGFRASSALAVMIMPFRQ